MSRPSRKIIARLATAVLGQACTAIGEEFQRGYLIDERAVMQVKPGMNAEQVLQTL